MPEGLLDLVKNFLDKTWTDQEMDKKIATLTKNAIAYLDEKSGIENDYMVEGRAQTLLLNHVAYALSNALDDFYINYKYEIVAFINKSRVKIYVKEQEDKSK